jgi:hypothetical protein
MPERPHPNVDRVRDALSRQEETHADAPPAPSLEVDDEVEVEEEEARSVAEERHDGHA